MAERRMGRQRRNTIEPGELSGTTSTFETFFGMMDGSLSRVDEENIFRNRTGFPNRSNGAVKMWPEDVTPGLSVGSEVAPEPHEPYSLDEAIRAVKTAESVLRKSKGYEELARARPGPEPEQSVSIAASNAPEVTAKVAEVVPEPETVNGSILSAFIPNCAALASGVVSLESSIAGVESAPKPSYIVAAAEVTPPVIDPAYIKGASKSSYAAIAAKSAPPEERFVRSKVTLKTARETKKKASPIGSALSKKNARKQERERRKEEEEYNKKETANEADSGVEMAESRDAPKKEKRWSDIMSDEEDYEQFDDEIEAFARNCNSSGPQNVQGGRGVKDPEPEPRYEHASELEQENGAVSEPTEEVFEQVQEQEAAVQPESEPVLEDEQVSEHEQESQQEHILEFEDEGAQQEQTEFQRISEPGNQKVLEGQHEKQCEPERALELESEQEQEFQHKQGRGQQAKKDQTPEQGQVSRPQQDLEQEFEPEPELKSQPEQGPEEGEEAKKAPAKNSEQKAEQAIPAQKHRLGHHAPQQAPRCLVHNRLLCGFNETCCVHKPHINCGCPPPRSCCCTHHAGDCCYCQPPLAVVQTQTEEQDGNESVPTSGSPASPSSIPSLPTNITPATPPAKRSDVEFLPTPSPTERTKRSKKVNIDDAKIVIPEPESNAHVNMDKVEPKDMTTSSSSDSEATVLPIQDSAKSKVIPPSNSTPEAKTKRDNLDNTKSGAMLTPSEKQNSDNAEEVVTPSSLALEAKIKSVNFKAGTVFATTLEQEKAKESNLDDAKSEVVLTPCSSTPVNRLDNVNLYSTKADLTDIVQSAIALSDYLYGKKKRHEDTDYKVILKSRGDEFDPHEIDVHKLVALRSPLIDAMVKNEQFQHEIEAYAGEHFRMLDPLAMAISYLYGKPLLSAATIEAVTLEAMGYETVFSSETGPEGYSLPGAMLDLALGYSLCGVFLGVKEVANAGFDLVMSMLSWETVEMILAFGNRTEDYGITLSPDPKEIEKTRGVVKGLPVSEHVSGMAMLAENYAPLPWPLCEVRCDWSRRLVAAAMGFIFDDLGPDFKVDCTAQLASELDRIPSHLRSTPVPTSSTIPISPSATPKKKETTTSSASAPPHRSEAVARNPHLAKVAFGSFSSDQDAHETTTKAVGQDREKTNSSSHLDESTLASKEPVPFESGLETTVPSAMFLGLPFGLLRIVFNHLSKSGQMTPTLAAAIVVERESRRRAAVTKWQAEALKTEENIPLVQQTGRPKGKNRKNKKAKQDKAAEKKKREICYAEMPEEVKELGYREFYTSQKVFSDGGGYIEAAFMMEREWVGLGI
ncbi:hypothetical protein BDV18DRAFT_159387 [Aspergillus unguis]